MKNWRTNIGGATGILGTTMIGVGVLAHLGGDDGLDPYQKRLLWYTAFAGFVVSGIGKAVTALFAADAKAVDRLRKELEGTDRFVKENVEEKEKGHKL